jgi:hypothetical protein
MAMDRHALNKWLDAIRQVLRQEWNPIPGSPKSEYDSYVRRLASLTYNGATDEQLVAFFKWAEVDNMGVSTETQFDKFRVTTVCKVIASLRSVTIPRLGDGQAPE